MAGKLSRYAKVGTAMGGIAARAAGARFFGLPLDAGAHAADLRAALGGLKGPLMKVAQILSTVPDILPQEYALELAELQTNAPSMGWAFVKRRMAAELGRDWPDRFDTFEREAAAAASLGQVHKALSHDGRALACKLQYPDMKSVVDADLAQLKLIFALYRRYDKALDPREIHAELSERLGEELDYRREARNMALYARMLAGEKAVHVPESLPELSTDRLLSMTWLDGAPLLSVTNKDSEARNAVAINMFHAWYVPFYGFGVIHGDPHLGNYTVRPDGSINLLDFGCIRVFRPTFVRAVIDLYLALKNDDTALAVHAYETWGFENLSSEMISVLNQWAGFLYGPLMEDRAQRVQETSDTLYGAEVAGKVHGELRRLGGITPPREFVLMDRAAIGLGSVFTHLRAEVNWHRLFHDLIENFDEAALAKHQEKALKAVGLEDHAGADPDTA